MATVVFVVGSTEERECNASVLGKRAPVSHPVNCKEECPYGYDRPFCFSCYKKIMQEHTSYPGKQERLMQEQAIHLWAVEMAALAKEETAGR